MKDTEEILDTRGFDGETVQPEVMLPCQFWDMHRPGMENKAELRLVSAILVDAINCYFSKSSYNSQKAEFWFIKSDGPFSFKHICDWLDIDSGRLWKRLQMLKESGNKVKHLNTRLMAQGAMQHGKMSLNS